MISLVGLGLCGWSQQTTVFWGFFVQAQAEYSKEVWLKHKLNYDGSGIFSFHDDGIRDRVKVNTG